MKIGTTELLKFKRLKGRLKLTQWQTIGLLESLWMFTSKNTPAGDIGRCSNEDIAFGIEWDGDPDDLIRVLVDTRWIDESEEYRLIIHDWIDHVPNWLKANFGSHKKTFVGQTAKQPTKQPAQGDEQAAKQPAEQPTKQPAQGDEQPALSNLPSNPPPRHATPHHETASHENSNHATSHHPSGSLGHEGDVCVGNGPEDPKRDAEMLRNLIAKWQTLPPERVVLIRGVPVPSKHDPNPDMTLAAGFLSQSDLDGFKKLIPIKYEAALEAMHAIVAHDALHYRDLPMRPRDFADDVDRICLGKKTIRKRTKTDDVKDSLKSLYDELDDCESNQLQQKRLT